MAKTEVKTELSQAQEIALMQRYGRGCSPETLVARAIAEAVTLKTPWQKPIREKREKKDAPPPPPNALPPAGNQSEADLSALPGSPVLTEFDPDVHVITEGEKADA